jgi:DNA-binding MarR family transcriptional regulator
LVVRWWNVVPKTNNIAADQVREATRAMDRLLEHRSRLGACLLLAQTEAMNFTRLRELLGETDGNLGAHLRKLEEANYIEVKKEFVDRKPISWYLMTDFGMNALRAHMAALEALVSSAPS